MLIYTHIPHTPFIRVINVATPSHLGKSTGSYVIDIFNDKDERTASARLTVFFKEKN